MTIAVSELSMLEKSPILIVEDEAIIALDLAMSVEAAGGIVIGPAPSVAEALSLLDDFAVAGAILDANLSDRDITPVALQLIKREIPLVVYTARGLPLELADKYPDLLVIRKPAAAGEVLDRLMRLMPLPA